MKDKTTLRQKTTLIIFGFILFALLIEISLRFAGFIYLSLQERRNIISLSHQDSYRILCLGDSNTAFGGKNSYPFQLEQILNQKYVHKRFSVINKGVPGIDTSGILSQLKYNLYKYQPDMVIVMMGINDFGDFSPEDSLRNKIKSFIKTLRIYKLAVLLREGIGKSKEPEDIYFKRGWYYLSQHNHTLAEEMFEKAIALAPQNDRLYMELGLYYLGQQKLTRAKEMFKKAVELAPKDARAYIQLGWCYNNNGRFAKAEEMFKKAIEINPDMETGYLNLGWYYQERRNYSLAEEMFKKVIALAPYKNEVYVDLGFCYIGQKKFAQAEEIFKKAIELTQEKEMAYIGLGWCYIDQKKFAEAEEMFKKSLSINELNEDAYTSLILLNQAQGRDADAKFYLSKARLPIEYHSNTIRLNYSKLRDTILKKGIRLVCMQYPTRSLKPLKEILGDREGITFVDNEKVFKEALKTTKYEDYFTDRFAGDFGHCTPKGNWLIANNIADVLLKEDFSSAEFQDE